jgi:histidyl-tRNA synthetase
VGADDESANGEVAIQDLELGEQNTVKVDALGELVESKMKSHK